MRLKQTTLGLLLLAASPAMAQNYEGIGLNKEQRLQIEQLYDLLGRVQQLTDSVAQEREALGKQKKLWRAVCEECLSKSVGQEKLQQLLKDQKKPWHTASEDSLSRSVGLEKLQQLFKLTLRDVDGEDLFKRLQNALSKPADDGKKPVADDGMSPAAKKNEKGKTKGKKQPKADAKATGNDLSQNDGKSEDDGADVAPGTGELSNNDGGTIHEYPNEQNENN